MDPAISVKKREIAGANRRSINVSDKKASISILAQITIARETNPKTTASPCRSSALRRLYSLRYIVIFSSSMTILFKAPEIQIVFRSHNSSLPRSNPIK